MNTRTLVDGIAFGEGPRWRDDRLWFSDIHGFRVYNVDLHGNLQTVVDVPQQPSGLGWTTDGRLLVVSMVYTLFTPVLHRWAAGRPGSFDTPQQASLEIP